MELQTLAFWRVLKAAFAGCFDPLQRQRRVMPDLIKSAQNGMGARCRLTVCQPKDFSCAHCPRAACPACQVVRPAGQLVPVAPFQSIRHPLLSAGNKEHVCLGRRTSSRSMHLAACGVPAALRTPAAHFGPCKQQSGRRSVPVAAAAQQQQRPPAKTTGRRRGKALLQDAALKPGERDDQLLADVVRDLRGGIEVSRAGCTSGAPLSKPYSRPGRPAPALR